MTGIQYDAVPTVLPPGPKIVSASMRGMSATLSGCRWLEQLLARDGARRRRRHGVEAEQPVEPVRRDLLARDRLGVRLRRLPRGARAVGELDAERQRRPAVVHLEAHDGLRADALEQELVRHAHERARGLERDDAGRAAPRGPGAPRAARATRGRRGARGQHGARLARGAHDAVAAAREHRRGDRQLGEDEAGEAHAGGDFTAENAHFPFPFATSPAGDRPGRRRSTSGAKGLRYGPSPCRRLPRSSAPCAASPSPSVPRSSSAPSARATPAASSWCSARRPCWDSHLPNARHRSAYFVEEIARRE